MSSGGCNIVGVRKSVGREWSGVVSGWDAARSTKATLDTSSLSRGVLETVTETIFSRIVKGELPSYKVWEDDDLVAILDIVPVNKGHVLILTKEPYPDAR